ncbi:thyroxine 5-deiodinase-like [Gigantopelta aegis]|uniref:thyroxine 5-deiodinase-like n=1 Tax=Gigantopelta aegis TaxID=1735272 RepID=UPI001B88D9D7|nr:thyroxine 5-deiodinase-like [Gigantopelta aegis]
MDSRLSWYRFIRGYVILWADIFLLVILRILHVFRSVPYIEPVATQLTKLVEWLPENLQRLRVKVSVYGITNVRFFHIIRAWKYEIFKLSEVGQKAPDVGLVRFDGVSCRLLDFMKPGRPLVVVFGSCT